MRKMRRLGVAGFGIAAVAALFSATAWACIAGPTLDVVPRQANAGSEVSLKGVSYNRNPVVVRFNALDGPIIGTIQPTGGTGTSSNWNLEGTVTLPADARPGNYVLIATQPSVDGKLTQIPTRGLVSISGTTAPVVGAPLTPAQGERPVGLAESDPVSRGTMVLIGLGVAGVGLFLAGMAALVASRRPEGAPAAARAAE
ncbi:MAG TPA: hypothetical protein VGV86_01390 [Acidimicrobiales bacterium]|nr:hypothetical protein [Acidimicrobiales bacterium]